LWIVVIAVCPGNAVLILAADGIKVITIGVLTFASGWTLKICTAAVLVHTIPANLRRWRWRVAVSPSSVAAHLLTRAAYRVADPRQVLVRLAIAVVVLAVANFWRRLADPLAPPVPADLVCRTLVRLPVAVVVPAVADLGCWLRRVAVTPPTIAARLLAPATYRVAGPRQVFVRLAIAIVVLIVADLGL